MIKRCLIINVNYSELINRLIGYIRLFVSEEIYSQSRKTHVIPASLAYTISQNKHQSNIIVF